MFESPGLEPIDRPLEHPPLEVFLGALEHPPVEQPDEARSPLPGQAVDRQMLGREGEEIVEIASDGGERLARGRRHHVEVYGQAGTAEEIDRAADLVGGVIAIKGGEGDRGKRLCPEADPIHTAFHGRRHEPPIDVGRIGLDGHLGAGPGHQPARESPPQPPQTFSAEVRRGATADVERVEVERGRETVELPPQRCEVAIDEIIPPGDDGEVAVAAAVPAERDMDIGGPRRLRGDWHDGTGATGLIGVGQQAVDQVFHRRIRS